MSHRRVAVGTDGYSTRISTGHGSRYFFLPFLFFIYLFYVLQPDAVVVS